MKVDAVDEALAENDAAIEALAPKASTRKITFRWPIGMNADSEVLYGDFAFIQAPLGFFPTQEFQTLMVKTIRETLQGKYGVSIGELLGGGNQLRAQMPSEITPETVDALVSGNNLKIIEAFLHLIEIVPELLLEIVALSLGVKRDRREEFKERISSPPHDGGLSLDDGVEIIMVFIKQNGGPIRRFLESQVREIGEQIMEAIGEARAKQETDTPGGMPSNTSSAGIPESA